MSATAGDLLIGDQNIRILDDRFQLVGVGDESKPLI